MTYRHVPLARAFALFAEAWRLTQWRFDFVALFLLNYEATIAISWLLKTRASSIATEILSIALVPGLWLVLHEFMATRRLRIRLNFALFLDPSHVLRLSGWLLTMAVMELGFDWIGEAIRAPYRLAWLTLLQTIPYQVLSGLVLPLQLFRGLDFPSALRASFTLLRSWPAISVVAFGQAVGVAAAAMPAMLLLPALVSPALYERGAAGIEWASHIPTFFLALLLVPLPMLVVAGPAMLSGYLLFRELAPPEPGDARAPINK